MRKYIIHYYVESSDECQEREIEIEEQSIMFALNKFQEKVNVYKRIFKIEEKVNV